MSDRGPTSTDTAVTPDDSAPPLRLPPWPWIWKLLGAIAVTGLGAIAFLTLFRLVRDLLLWVAIALFASFALEPAVSYLAKRGWKRGLTTFLIIFGLVILSVLMVGSMIPLLVKQLQALIKAAPGILQSVDSFTKRYFNVDVSVDALRQQLTSANSAVANFANNIAGHLFGVASSIIGTIFKMLTIGLFTYYLTADGPRVRRAVCSYLPPRYQDTVLQTWEVGIDKTGAYLYSRLLLAAASGLATFIVLTVLGVDFALPLAVWMGLVSQFIPTIGTYIAMALPLLVAVVASPVDALVLLIFFVLYQQVENYVLSPRITARTMELHPAVAFGVAIAGISIAGVVGAFLALPFAAIVQALGSTFIHRHDVQESELTRDADDGKDDGPGEPKKERDGPRLFDRFRRRPKDDRPSPTPSETKD